MKAKLILILSCILPICSYATDPIRIGLFYGQEFQRATITCVSGQLELQVDNETVGILSANEQVDISMISGQLQLVLKGVPQKADKSIKLISKIYSQFKIQPVGLKANSRIYEGHVTAVKAPGRIQLMNTLHLEKYISGVIEAEGGSKHHLEYYKVQAIISRTYASSNRRRHEAEGFELCDATHCQVYHGISRFEPLTKVATELTEDIVIVDENIDLITAAFHSNCGGHTINAQDAWSKPLSYCVARPDSFCLVMPNSNWEKTIPAETWKAYLRKKQISPSDSIFASTQAYFPASRQFYFADSTLKIPNRVIRQDFKLKSAFFTVHEKNEQITFIGQGFGHGVGLCQEGAIRMASLGYSYNDIIHYYYHKVHLVPLRFLWFFKAD